MQYLDDTRDKERSRICCTHHPHMHAVRRSSQLGIILMSELDVQDTDIDLMIQKDTLLGRPCQSLHTCFSHIHAHLQLQERPVFLFQEFGSLWPINNQELSRYSIAGCADAFYDEDPSPACVAAETVHFRDGVGQKL